MNDITNDMRARHMEKNAGRIIEIISDNIQSAREDIIHRARTNPDRLTKPEAYKAGGRINALEGLLEDIDNDIRREAGKK